MNETAELKRISKALSKPDRELYFAPIRHHSPACAWAVRELIRDIKPEHILIEAPVDFEPHIDILLDNETKPPIAIASLIERKQQTRLAAYYPFCSHSPEYIALKEGKKIGAKLSFIDLPSTDKVLLRETDSEKPLNLQNETGFDSGTYITKLATKLGCRDGFELWDHLFETRLGSSDWKSFFADVGAYCAGLRAATPDQQIEQYGDNKREHHMAAALLNALDKTKPVLAVVGGFHMPALLDLVSGKTRETTELSKEDNRSYVIRYGFAALDALNGYASGLPQPGYYDLLWKRAEESEGSPQWRQTALDLVSDFTTLMRKQGHPISVPAQIEILRSAECLAHMRNRPGALRHDLIDGVQLALTKGETGISNVWTERLLKFLCGNKLGDIPASAGSPPLVEEVRRRAKQLRINIEDGGRQQRKLDIRRKKPHLAASRFFHAMTLLDTGFADRLIGPDYIHNVRTDLLFEEWSYAWSPQVEGRLVETAIYGDQLETACIGILYRHRKQLQEEGHGRGLEEMIDLFTRGLLAGLGIRLIPFLNEIENDIQTHGDFATTASILRKLHHIQSSTGPIGAPKDLNLQNIMEVAYARLIYLCDDLPNTPKDSITSNLEALRLTTELLRSDDNPYDHSLFDEAIDRIANSSPPPEILGAVLAICIQAKKRAPEEIAKALTGSFSGVAVTEENRIAVLRGILHTVPGLLWREGGILKIVDDFIRNLSEESFIELLPHLRLSFTAFNPRETDRLAKLLGQLHGASEGNFTPSSSALTEEDLQRGLAIESKIRDSIQADNLDDWLLTKVAS